MAAATRDEAKEAIAQVLREALADHALLAAPRGTAPTPVADPKPSAWTKLKATVRAAATRVTTAVKYTVFKLAERVQPAVIAVTARVRRVRERAVAARRLFELGWRVLRAAVVGLGVAVTVLVACQFSHATALAAAGSGLNRLPGGRLAGAGSRRARSHPGRRRQRGGGRAARPGHLGRHQDPRQQPGRVFHPRGLTRPA